MNHSTKDSAPLALAFNCLAFRAKFGGRCAYSGLRFRAGDDIYHIAPFGWVAGMTLIKLGLRTMGGGAFGIDAHAPFDAEQALELLRQRYAVTVHTNLSSRSYRLEGGRVIKLSYGAWLTPDEWRARCAGAIMMSVKSARRVIYDGDVMSESAFRRRACVKF